MEAYTARKQAVRVQLRNRFIIATPTPLAWRKAASGQPIVRGCSGVAGVPSPGHAFKRTSREPRRAPDLSRAGCGSAQPEKNQVPRETRAFHGKRTDPRRGVPAAKGDRRGQERVGEQSYAPIVPMKAGNRRASDRSGHGTHWREGANRSTYRCSATYARHRTRESMSNDT